MSYAVNDLHDEVFKQYFNAGDEGKVQDVFKKALGGNPSSGSDALGEIYITNLDVNKQCGYLTLLGYHGKGGSGQRVIHLCDRVFNKPLIKDVKCDDLQGTVGSDMAVMGATILHEFMHDEKVGKAALGKEMIDVKDGYGPLQTRNLKESDALINADSYTWMATENLWTVLCRKTFSGPRDASDASNPDCGGKTCTVQ